MRFFFAAHGARVPGLGVEKARFLIDLAAIFQNVDLTARLIFDGLADKADGVDVLDLAARAEFRTRAAHRHVHVGPQRAFLHIAIACAEIAHDGAELRDVGSCFFR